MKRKAIVILGMHRSGTSALGGVLNLLGVSAPKTLMPATDDNPRGYWESSRLMTAHDELLGAAGSYWDDFRPLDLNRIGKERLSAEREKIRSAIQDEFAGSSLFFIKDPRLCRIFPFLRGVLDEMDVQPLVLLPFRNPIEVAKSLERRDGFSRSKSLLLWLRHVLDAEFHSRGLPRHFLAYDEFLSNWRHQLSETADKIGIRWPVAIPDASAEIDRFLSDELHRERSDMAQIEESSEANTWILDAYQTLRKAAHNKNGTASDALDTLRAKLNEASGLFESMISANAERIQEIEARVDAGARELQDTNRRLNAATQEIGSLNVQISVRDGHIALVEAERDEAVKRISRLREQLSLMFADGSLGNFRNSRLGLRLRSLLRYPLSSKRRKEFRTSQSAELLSKLEL